MKYLLLVGLGAAFAVHAQNFGQPATGVPASTTPQGPGTTLAQPGTSPSTIGAGNFTSPATSINFGTTPPNPNVTTPSNTTQSFNQPTSIPGGTNTTLPTDTPSNNPLPQAQEAPLNFSTLPDSSVPASGVGTNPSAPAQPFPAVNP